MTLCNLTIYALLGCVFHSMVQAVNGIIGMGITMYKPLCCNACDAALSELYLTCTEFANGEATTSADCRMSNGPWLESIATCLESKCSPHSTVPSSIQHCWEKLSGQETEYTTFVSTALVPQLNFDSVWLNQTSFPNDEVFNTTIQSYKEWEYEETMHSILA